MKLFHLLELVVISLKAFHVFLKYLTVKVKS